MSKNSPLPGQWFKTQRIGSGDLNETFWFRSWPQVHIKFDKWLKLPSRLQYNAMKRAKMESPLTICLVLRLTRRFFILFWLGELFSVYVCKRLWCCVFSACADLQGDVLSKELYFTLRCFDVIFSGVETLVAEQPRCIKLPILTLSMMREWKTGCNQEWPATMFPTFGGSLPWSSVMKLFFGLRYCSIAQSCVPKWGYMSNTLNLEHGREVASTISDFKNVGSN